MAQKVIREHVYPLILSHVAQNNQWIQSLVDFFFENQKFYSLFTTRHLALNKMPLLHITARCSFEREPADSSVWGGELFFFPSFCKIFPASLLSCWLPGVIYAHGFPWAAVQSHAYPVRGYPVVLRPQKKSPVIYQDSSSPLADTSSSCTFSADLKKLQLLTLEFFLNG